MPHSESQISMRPICSDLLFTLVDYIFMTCLTKCPSWLVGVQSRSYSSNCISTIIYMLSYYYEGFIQFWEVTWALDLKMWLKSWGQWHRSEKNSPWTLACLPMRVSRGPWTLAFPQHERVQRSSGSKYQWDLGVVGMVSKGPNVIVEGLYGEFLSIPLP